MSKEFKYSVKDGHRDWWEFSGSLVDTSTDDDATKFHWDVYAKMRIDKKGDGIRLTITEINCEAAPTIADCVYHLQVRIADVALAVANNSGMEGEQQE